MILKETSILLAKDASCVVLLVFSDVTGYFLSYGFSSQFLNMRLSLLCAMGKGGRNLTMEQAVMQFLVTCRFGIDTT